MRAISALVVTVAFAVIATAVVMVASS